MAQQLPDTRTPGANPATPPPHDDQAAEPGSSEASRRPAAVLSRSLLGLLLVLAAVAYRRLAFWNPDPASLPVAEWFFFGWSRISPQIVLAVAAVLLLQRRRFVSFASRGEGSPALALPLLGITVVLFVWGTHADAPDVLVASLISVTLGGALLLFGTRFLRRVALPILFLAFAIPPAGVVVNLLVVPLQLWTAIHTEWVLNAAGISAIQEGNVVHLADGGVFQVVDSCSGLRSIEVLTMLAVAWVSVLALPRWHAVLFVASAPLIAYAANVGRAVSLTLWPQSEFSVMHSVQGLVLFVVGIAALAAVDAVLRRFWREEDVAAGPSPPASDAARRCR